MVCDGILRTEFGRRPSEAVSKAILHLAAEGAAPNRPSIAARPNSLREWLNQWLRQFQPRQAFAAAVVLVLAIGLSAYFIRARGDHGARGQGLFGCKLTDAAGLRWAGKSPRLKVGDNIPAGWLQLESGVIEITFATTAKAAVEGPAQFQLTGGNSLELQSGKIATDVPRHAKGFTVKTPTATVVDLGTRFGAIVGADKSSEVDVFQGRIRLTPEGGTASTLTAGMAMFVDERGATPGSALPQTAFPQPNLQVEVRPQNCGFDVSGRAAVGEVPVDFGYWSGLSYVLTGAVEEVQPASGPGMLEFFNSSAPRAGNSEVWQLVDLRPYKKLLAGGRVVAKLTALFNRVAGDANAANKFGLTLAAFQGSPADAKTMWSSRQTRALALADTELAADNKPETWETLEADTQLPAGTDFVIVQIRAIAPPGASESALAGHFADKVDLLLCTPMRTSSIAIE